MRILNQKGQAAVFFMLLVPGIVLMLVATVKFSRTVFWKMKLQGALDRSVYAGGAYLTETLNRMVVRNQKARDLFEEVRREFRAVSQPNPKKAKERIRKLWLEQNVLYEEMDELEKNAYRNAWQIANEEFQKDFPGVSVTPIYAAPIVLKDGPKVDFSFDRVKGKTIFDPTGHQKLPKTGLEARMAFVKDPGRPAAFAVAAEIRNGMNAVAAAQPLGGSLWNFKFYQTALVPLKTLPPGGFMKGLDLDGVEH